MADIDVYPKERQCCLLAPCVLNKMLAAQRKGNSEDQLTVAVLKDIAHCWSHSVWSTQRIDDGGMIV